MASRFSSRPFAARLFAAASVAAVVGAWLVVGACDRCQARPIQPDLRTPLVKPLRWMPDGANILMSFNVKAVLRSEAAKTLIKEFPKVYKELEEEFTREVGLKFDDIERVTMGGNPKDRGPVIVMELNRAVKPDMFLSQQRRQDWEEEEVGGQTIYVGGSNAWCIPDDRTIVGGPTEIIRQVVAAGRKPSLSKELQGYVDRLDFAQAAVIVFIVKETERHFLAPFIPQADPEQFQAFTFQGDVGSDARFAADIVCRDAASAAAVQQTVNAGIEQVKNEQGVPQSVRDLLGAIDVSVSGNTLQGKATLTMRLLRDLAQSAADEM